MTAACALRTAVDATDPASPCAAAVSLPELLAYIEKQKEALELRDVDGGELDASREAAAVVAARSAAAPHS